MTRVPHQSAREPRTFLGIPYGEAALILAVVVAITAGIALFASAALGNTGRSASARTSQQLEREVREDVEVDAPLPAAAWRAVSPAHEDSDPGAEARGSHTDSD